MTPEEKLIVNRLKATYADVDEMEKVFAIVSKAVALREAEIEQLKALLTRAADALAFEMMARHSQIEIRDHSELIDELRKAAE